MSNIPSLTSSSRRQFLTASLGAATGSLILGNTRASAKVVGANNRLRIAVVGVNGRGKSHIEGWMGQDNVEIAYIVDPDAKVRDRTLANIQKKTDGPFSCKGVADVRAVLDDPEVDAISIATPNHWHSLMTIWGAQAGKHVYVEKPMSHDVHEGRVAVEAQRKYGVVVQHGTQRRSDAKIAGLHEAIKAGKFGRLKISYGYCCKPRGTIGFEFPKPPAADLDWNLWRGPAVIHQYHDNYVHYDWHWFWGTGNGDMNNQGTHQLDVARWALDDDQTHPVRVMGMGNRFQWKDQGETPNTMFAAAEYPNGQWVYFNVRNVNYDGYQNQVENEYYFEDGGRIVRGKYYTKGSDAGEDLNIESGKVTPGGNWGSFIAACREGKPEMANGTAIEAHNGCVLGHLMNNSYRLGQEEAFSTKAGGFEEGSDLQEHFGRLHGIMSKGVGLSEKDDRYIVGPWLTFDPKSESHTGEHAAEADRLLKDVNRQGFEIPDVSKV
jgi:predicted dehydrogenase